MCIRDRCRPWEKGTNERFNGALAEDVLKREIVSTLRGAEVFPEQWRGEYNTIRPHSAHGHCPPAPKALRPNRIGLNLSAPAGPSAPQEDLKTRGCSCLQLQGQVTPSEVDRITMRRPRSYYAITVFSPMLVLLTAAGMAASAEGQQRAVPPGTIRGLAFDSTRMAPLAGAQVSLAGGAGRLVADQKGEFTFEDVPPGEYPLVVSHPRLDSLGLTPILRVVTVRPDRGERVEFATPSIDSFRALYCGDGARSGALGGRDGLLVGGVVDRLTGVPFGQAKVLAEWSAADGTTLSSISVTDAGGAFALCDVPRSEPIRVSVELFNETHLRETINLRGSGILLQDLELRLTEAARVLGRLTDRESGQSIDGAVVRLKGTEFQTLTSATGRFLFPEVPPGEYVLETEHVGYGTQTRSINVGARTVDIDAELSQVAIELEGLTVTVRARPPVLNQVGYYERRERLSGVARFYEQEELVSRSQVSLATALAQTLGVRVVTQDGVSRMMSTRGRKGIEQRPCYLRLIVDGVLMSRDDPALDALWNLESFLPNQVAAVEIYPSDNSLPQKYRSMGNMTQCGAVVIWSGKTEPAGSGKR